MRASFQPPRGNACAGKAHIGSLGSSVDLETVRGCRNLHTAGTFTGVQVVLVGLVADSAGVSCTGRCAVLFSLLSRLYSALLPARKKIDEEHDRHEELKHPSPAELELIKLDNWAVARIILQGKPQKIGTK